MEKIIISKRHLDCVRKQRENNQLSSCFLNDFDARLKRSIELREEFSDIIPFSSDDKKNNGYRDWETDRKSTRLNSSHRSLSRMPSSA